MPNFLIIKITSIQINKYSLIMALIRANALEYFDCMFRKYPKYLRGESRHNFIKNSHLLNENMKNA